MQARICIFGVGAIGGYLAARFALAGQPVTGIARGAQLAAIRRNGLILIENGERLTASIACVEEPADAGPQDFVFLTMKSHAVPSVAATIAPLLGADTVVITACNGFPWWYFHALDRSDKAPILERVDPGARLWNAIGPQRAIGSVVYPAARTPEPGMVEHIFGNRFTLGEPDGSMSERVRILADLCAAAGFEAPVVADIRTEIWAKLVMNAAYNPVSLLTGGTLGDMLDDAGVHSLLARLMGEVVRVAATLAVVLPLAPEQLIGLTRPLGAHQTSMLQDLEAGRAVELDTIVGAIRDLARLSGVATPVLDAIFALASQRARLAGCYDA